MKSSEKIKTNYNFDERQKLDEIKRQRELKVLTDNLNLYKYLNIDKLLKNTKRLFKGKKALSFSKKDEKSSESVLEFAVKCIKDNWKIKEYRNLIKASLGQGLMVGASNYFLGLATDLMNSASITYGALVQTGSQGLRQILMSNRTENQQKLETKIKTNKITEEFSKIQEESPRIYLRHLSEKTKQNITSLAEAYTNATSAVSLLLLGTAGTIAAGTTLLAINPTAGAITLTTSSLAGYLAVKTRQKLTKAFQPIRQRMSFYNARRSDAITQMEYARQYNINTKDNMKKDTNDEQILMNKVARENSKIRNMVNLGITFGVGGFAALWCSTKGVELGASTGSMLAFIGASITSAWSVWETCAHYSTIKESQITYNKFKETLKVDEKQITKQGNEKIPYKFNTIELQNVDFSHDKSKKQMSSTNISFIPGQLQCIVGKSGNGKSTLTDLLAHVYDVDNGKILINGVDVQNTTEKEVEKHLAITDQYNHNFSTYSVRENMEMLIPTEQQLEKTKKEYEEGKIEQIEYLNLKDLRENADERIYEALEMACATELYYGEKNGKQGCEHNFDPFSEGEKQRLSLARAFLSNRYKDISVFDECTSKLDPIHAEEIVCNFKKLANQGKNVIVVTHDPKLMALADNVTVMENMNVTGHGKIEEVYRTNNYLQGVFSYESEILTAKEKAFKRMGEDTFELSEELNILKHAESIYGNIELSYQSNNQEKLKENLSNFLNGIKTTEVDDIDAHKKAYQRVSQMILRNPDLLKACEGIFKDIKEPKNTSFEENTPPSSQEDDKQIEEIKEISPKYDVKEKKPTPTLEENILRIVKTNHINE